MPLPSPSTRSGDAPGISRARLASAAALLLAAAVTTGCPGGGDGSSGARPGPGSSRGPAEGAANVLVFARGGDSVGLDPAHEDDGESLKVANSLYDTLVQFRRGTTEIEPGLAESWEVTDDGLTYTFHLRDGVTFHDGTPFDADAVLFSLLRQHDEEHPHHGIGGSYKYWGGMGMSSIVDTIEKAGPHEVVIRLKKPEAAFLANLAMDFASIVSPTAARELGEDFKGNPVGTGPFLFDRWDREQRIVLRANDDYWGGRPDVDTLIFEVVKDPQIRALRFQSGEVDGFDNPSPSELRAVEDLPHARVLQEPGMNVGYLAMNTQREPFDDPRVRIALNHAIDKKRLIEDIYKGTGTPAKNPLPPTLWGYNDDIEPFEHDPAEARRLLAEAGHPDGFETTLWYMPVPRPYMPDGKKVAESIQLDLAQIGVRARLVTYDWGTYLSKLNEGEHDMALLGWSGDNGDPDNFLYVLLSKQATEKPAQNIAFWRHDEFDRLITQAKETTDQDERERLYRQAQEVFHEEPPWVPLAHNLQTVVLHERVDGFQLYPTTRKDFRDVTLKGAAESPGQG